MYMCPVEVNTPCSTPSPTRYRWGTTPYYRGTTKRWWEMHDRRKRWVTKQWYETTTSYNRWSPGSWTTYPRPTDYWWPDQDGGTLCKSQVHRPINDVKCNIQCCNGEDLDPVTGACHKGDLTCMNGGTLGHDKMTCRCPTGFSGSRCQHRECSIECQNGGVCKTNGTGILSDTTHNDDYCLCPADTTGKFCETNDCSHCKNNGTCTGSGYGWSWCTCMSGFSGKFCEIVNKNGTCPSIVSIGTCAVGRVSSCRHDDECPGNQKCCEGCGWRDRCMDPVFDQKTCRYNNQTYQIGSVFRPDPCRVCTCNSSHGSMPHGVVECTKIVCPRVIPNCRNVLHPQDKCCPVCGDEPDSRFCGDTYTPPKFLNCPQELVVLDVDEASDSAKVDLHLRAVDCNGKDLQVDYSDRSVRAGKGENNFMLLSATTEADANGNFSECLFHVRVRDIHPPKFVTCPVDFVQPAPGAVTWQVPIATDNVGLAVEPTSRINPGETMTPGSHVVLYWAEDYQGNIARCTFVVTVGNTGTGAYMGGGGDGQGHSHEPGGYRRGGHAMGIAFGVIGGLLLLLVPAVVYLLCRRKRNSARLSINRDTPTMAMATAGTGNGVAYAVSNNQNGVILPRYTLTASPDDVMIAPPTYTARSVDDVTGMACGGQEAGALPQKNPLPQ
nr:hypothetical protein BaRGS_021407 [Batillaria attramentaria]